MTICIMKKFRYILAIAALILGAASCTILPEDAFSTDPVAPEFLAHADILMTANTMDEDVNFTWTAYRNLPEGLNYVLKASYLNDPKVIATVNTTSYKTTKTAFKELLYTTFPTLPENDTFVLSFEVSVLDAAGNEYVSNAMGVTIYAYGDAVAPVITVPEEDIVLDPAEAMAEMTLLSWEPARLVYGEKVTYNVYLTTVTNVTPATKAVNVQPYLLAEGLSETSYSTTVDALNDAIIAAGGPENAKVPVRFLVKAFCESLPEGIEATSADLNVTTFVATFAELLYTPGSHQGWDPATAATIKLSKTIKGYYEGILDLTTKDGSNAQFKFSPNPKWEGEFGGKVEADADKAGFYSGTVGASDNIEVPSGIYVIMLNKKLNKINLVEIKSLGAIGTAFGGWDKELPMIWDKETNVFTVTADIVPGEYKFRLNDAWDFSIDNTGGVNGGGANYETALNGNYKVSVDMSKHPYTVKFANTSFPEVLYVPGSHNDWKHSATVLQGDGNGRYEGFTTVGGQWGFKFTPTADPDWKDGEWGLDKTTTPETNEGGETTYMLTASGAGNIAEGSEVAYSRVIVDLNDLTAKVLPIKSVELCGTFTSWGVKEEFFLKYSADTDSWKIEGVEIPKGAQWKFRMNSDDQWTANLGYVKDDPSLENLVQGGENITDTAPGIYTIELFLNKAPYRAKLTKTGEAGAVALPETMYIIGNDFGGWSWDAAGVVEMTPVNGVDGAFWAIRYMTATTEFKFSPEKAWGKDFCKLTTNQGFSTPNNNQVEAAGLYMICVDAKNEKVIVEPAKIYGIGGCFGGWDNGAAFTVANDGKASITTTADSELRMYATASCYNVSWWQMEFIILNGKIAYRGNGGEQERVNVASGKTVTLNFNAGTGTIE